MYITEAQNRYRIQQMPVYKRLLQAERKKKEVDCGQYRT